MTESITPERTAPQPQNSQPPQNVAVEPASSGHRVAAGIVAIVLSFVLSFDAVLNLSAGNVVPALVISLASLGNLASGIVILVLHRQRSGNGPKIVLGMAIFGILAGLLGAVTPIVGAFMGMLAFAAAIVILWAISSSIAKDKSLSA